MFTFKIPNVNNVDYFRKIRKNDKYNIKKSSI